MILLINACLNTAIFTLDLVIVILISCQEKTDALEAHYLMIGNIDSGSSDLGLIQTYVAMWSHQASIS